MKTLKRFGALVMALCLFAGSALAAVPGLDTATAAWLDVADDVTYSLSAQLDALPPYGEETVAMLNGVLKHLSMNAAVSGGQSDIALLVGGESVATLTERVMESGTALTTPLLPNRTLVSASSAMEKAFGGEAQPEDAFDALNAFDEAAESYRALTDAILPYATEKKASYKIKYVGSSHWSRIARLTPEQSAELAPLIAAVLGSGMDAAYRERLAQLTYGKGFIVGLYQTEEGGDDIAVYMKGSVSFPEGGTAQLAYQWAFAETDAKRVDTYKFTLGKSKAPNTAREITARYTRTNKSDGYDLNGTCTTRLLSKDATDTTTVNHAVQCRESEAGRTLAGEITTTRKAGKASVSTTVKPDLAVVEADGSGALSGTVSCVQKEGKKTAMGVTLTFAETVADAFVAAAESGDLYAVAEPAIYDMPQSSLDQNAEEPADEYLVGRAPTGLQSYTAPETPQIVDLDTLAPAQHEALMGEATQNLAGRLLIALAKLPAEDIQLLSDNMNEADFAAFLKLVEGL